MFLGIVIVLLIRRRDLRRRKTLRRRRREILRKRDGDDVVDRLKLSMSVTILLLYAEEILTPTCKQSQ